MPYAFPTRFYELDAGSITALRIYMPMDQLLAQIGATDDAGATRHTI